MGHERLGYLPVRYADEDKEIYEYFEEEMTPENA